MIKKPVIVLDRRVFEGFAKLETSREERLVKPAELEKAIAKDPLMSTYYWIIEYLVPAKLAPDRKEYVDTLKISGKVPVVFIGPDIAKSRQEIETLKILFEYHNPDFRFGLSYLSRQLLDEKIGDWFEWGDPIWDLICTECGEITPSPIVVERFLCSCCDPFGRNYLVRLPKEILCEKCTES